MAYNYDIALFYFVTKWLIIMLLQKHLRSAIVTLNTLHHTFLSRMSFDRVNFHCLAVCLRGSVTPHPVVYKIIW